MKFNNNQGVSIITLVLTIIVMLMVTSFAVYYSTNITPEARVASIYTSLKEVRRACMEAKSSIVLRPDLYDEFDFFGKSIFTDGSDVEDIAKKCGLTSSDKFSQSTYKVSPKIDDENKRRVEKLEISNVDREYICDIGNNKYYVLGGVKRQTGEISYEYNDIESMYNLLTETN